MGQERDRYLICSPCVTCGTGDLNVPHVLHTGNFAVLSIILWDHISAFFVTQDRSPLIHSKEHQPRSPLIQSKEHSAALEATDSVINLCMLLPPHLPPTLYCCARLWLEIIIAVYYYYYYYYYYVAT